ncbi:MAG: hypothetical protein MUE74_10120 [Bacteroidales bacterium]|nr:hypothetical protein [Bacteroidales bacterium]
MPVKTYTQKGIFSVVILLPVLVFCIAMLFVAGVDEPFAVIIFSLVIMTFIICLLIFYKMTITIDDTLLTFTMGIGLIRKSYPLSDISACRPVKNSPLYGVGMHMTADGWLYNVSGKYAIELSFKSRKKKIRIGTDKPEEISRAVNSLISGSMQGAYVDRGNNGGFFLILAMVAATIVLPIVLIVLGSRETKVSFSQSEMKLTGVYGLNIAFSDIISADTMQSLPSIKSRTNGYAAGNTLKGHFRLQDQSKVMLFVKKGIPPYIRLKTSETTVWLNFDSPGKTREVFSRCKYNI